MVVELKHIEPTCRSETAAIEVKRWRNVIIRNGITIPYNIPRLATPEYDSCRLSTKSEIGTPKCATALKPAASTHGIWNRKYILKNDACRCGVKAREVN